MKNRIKKFYKNVIEKWIFVLAIIVIGVNAYSEAKSKTLAASNKDLDKIWFIGDSRTNGIKSGLTGAGAIVTAKDGSNASHWLAYFNGTSSSITDAKPDSSSFNAICVAIGINNPAIGSMKDLLDKLISSYPGKKIYVQSTYYVGEQYNGGTTAQSLNNSVNTYNSQVSSYCASKSELTYVNTSDGLHSGNMLKSSYCDHGGSPKDTHMNSTGNAVYLANIKSKLKGAGTGDYQEEENPASTVAGARQEIVNFAKDFANRHGHRTLLYYNGMSNPPSGACHYTWDNDKRGPTCNGPTEGQTLYKFDCVGWVSFCIKHSTGVPTSSIGSYGMPFYATPQNGICDTVHFKQFSYADRQPGDILIAPGKPHVAIYIGNDQMVDMWGTDGRTSRGNGGLGGGPGDERSINASWIGGKWTSVARLVSVDGQNFDFGSGTPEDQQYAGDKDIVDLDALQGGLKFSGLPKNVVFAGGTSNFNIIDFLKNLLDFILGLMFLGLKIVMMAIFEIIENFTSDILADVQGAVISE